MLFAAMASGSPHTAAHSIVGKTKQPDVNQNQFSWGTYTGGRRGKTYRARSSEKKIQLGQWYHFRFEWRIAPGTNRGFCQVWMSDQRKGDQLTAEDMWCNYHGPIGYAAAAGNPTGTAIPSANKKGFIRIHTSPPMPFTR